MRERGGLRGELERGWAGAVLAGAGVEVGGVVDAEELLEAVRVEGLTCPVEGGETCAEKESGEVMWWKGLMRKGRKDQAPLSATSKPGCSSSTYRVVKRPRRLSTILSDDANGME